jgi:beta-lactamase regulating signal transducer with metallopeptidase domain
MNYLNDIFSEQFIYSLGWTLVHSLWQGAIIGFAIALAMIFLHKYTARLRYFINSLGLFAFAAAALITFASSYLSYTGPADEIALSNTAKSYSITNQYAVLKPEEAASGFSLPAMMDATASYCRDNLPLFVTVWLMGMMAMLLRFMGGYALVRRYKTHRVKPVMGDWEKRFNQLARNIQLNANVRLLESALVKIPMAIGYLKPVVLIPLGALNGVPAHQMEAILVHELAHIKRRDYLMNLIQSILEVIFFYHPVVWWLSKNIRVERENICDDIAITQTGNTMEFAKALTSIQELNLGSPALAAGLSGKNKNRLLNRIRRLTAKPKMQSGFAEGFIAASILLISFAGLSAAAMISNPAQDLQQKQLSFHDVGEALPGISYYREAVVVPDTTDKEKEKQIQEAKEAYLQQQKELQAAIEAEMKAVEEQMKQMQEHMEQIQKTEALEQYEKAIQAYEEAMKNAQYNIQRSSSWSLPNVFLKDGKNFFYDGDSTVWSHHQPGFFYYEGDSLNEVFIDQWSDNWESAWDAYEDRLNYREMELEDLYENFEELDDLEDLMELKEEELARNFEFDYDFDHDYHFTLPNLYYSQGNLEKIIREELHEDDLIRHGREYIVLIDKKQMLINGEKQPKSVFKKYRRLVDSMENSWGFDEDEEIRIHIGR